MISKKTIWITYDKDGLVFWERKPKWDAEGCQWGMPGSIDSDVEEVSSGMAASIATILGLKNGDCYEYTIEGD